MDATFVRKDFYITPPDVNATPEVWADWVEKDNRKASAAKATYTKSFTQTTEAPEWLAGTGDQHTTKRGGKYTQGTIVGFSGSAEDGTLKVERVCPNPTPDTLMELKAQAVELESARNKRGGSRAGKSSRRRKNRKKRR